jgi:hypothetical protein
VPTRSRRRRRSSWCSGSHAASMTMLCSTSRPGRRWHRGGLGRRRHPCGTSPRTTAARWRVGVLGDDVDDRVGQAGEVRGLPVVVPPVGDRVVEAALVVGVRRGSDEVDERRPNRRRARTARSPSSTVRRSSRPPRSPAGSAGPRRRPAAAGSCRAGRRCRARRARRRRSRGRSAARRWCRSAAQKTGPAITVGPTGCSANRNEVTTPKLPPPPRSAQNRSGCSSADARTMLALGGDHLGGEQVVDGEPVLAHEPADAAAEGEPADAGVAHDAAGGGQTVGLRLVVDVAPQGTALHPGRAPAGSTRTARIAERSMTMPSSHTAVPATLWPPPRTRSRGRDRARSAPPRPRRRCPRSGRSAGAAVDGRRSTRRGRRRSQRASGDHLAPEPGISMVVVSLG